MEAWKQHQQMTDESQFRNLPWYAIGPKFAGGRIEAIDTPHGDLGTIYAGVGSGGVWKSVNGGLTWKHIFQHESTFAIGDLTVAPSDPNTIWVGTGECHVGRMSYAGTGVFKSEDAGTTWTNLGLQESYHIGQVAIDPQVKDRVYVAAMGERKSGGQRGIFKTTDGGKTFRRVLYEGERVSFVDLVIDPSDSKRLFASAWDRGNGSKSGVFRSDDHGENWKRLGGGLLDKQVDRVAIAVSNSQPGVVYALMADRSSPKLAQRKPASILFRSDDFGETWVPTHEGYVPTYVGWDFCDVQVAPDDAKRVYIGGFRLIISHDGGKTFQGEGGLAHNTTRKHVFRLHRHQGMGLHLDVHAIWIDPEHPQRVMLGNDGGLFVSNDRGETWLHLNNLPIAEFYRVYLDNQTPFQIWGGTQDNASFVGPSTARFETGEDDWWQQVFLDPWSGGDGFSTFPDPNDSQTVFFTQQNGDLKRAILGKLDSSKNIRPRAEPGDADFRWSWDTPFFASQHPGQTILYCAAQRVMRSIDRGETWKAVSPDLDAGSLTALAESPLDPQRMVAGDGRGKVHLTSDGGKNWVSAEGLPNRTVREVACSVHDPDLVYVVLSGRVENDSASYVYATPDDGKTWIPIMGNLPHESVNAITEDPQVKDLLFVGTDLGVYVSIDAGKNWESLCGSLPTAAVVDVELQGRDGMLVAATHGLSLFLLDINPIRKVAKKGISTD
jgi:photosystem II stability/assembly factor-like uncharacterized protein